MAPLAAAIWPMCDLGAQLQPAGISCMLVFGEGGKLENPEKNPRSREENQHKLNPLMALGSGIELNGIEPRLITTVCGGSEMMVNTKLGYNDQLAVSMG